MESAEDLLRTRSIKSLRALVSSLEASANAKQSELQLTVGSKYHEFIQSADCIAHMQNKADQLDQLIKHFSAASKVVLSQAQAVGLFIGGQNMIGESTSSDLMVGDEYKRIEHKRKINSLELSPKCLWHLLDRCNVFVAAQLIVMAERVSHHSISLHTRSDGLELYDINQSIPSYDNDSKDERKRSFFGNVKSCIFLRDVSAPLFTF